VTYVDLGKYTFTTAADYTGFNPGNLTSVLDPAAIRVADYELYRLLINTSGVPSPGQLPAVVQAATPVIGASATTLDINFAQDTTKGNLIVAGVSSVSATGNNPAVLEITLGGSADNWGQVVTATASDGATALIGADPATAEASTAIVVTLTGGTGSGFQTIGMAWEITNTLDTTDSTACYDVDDYFYSGAPTDTAQTANLLTTTANDMLVGFGAAYSGATFAVQPQPQGWPGSLLQTRKVAADAYGGAIGSYAPAGAAGSSSIYQAAAGSPVEWALLSAAFLPAAVPAAAAPLPFTVAVDGVTWDSEQAAAGVGYTYSLGQSPLYLKTGQTLQIFWQLPAAQYLGYLPAFNITGWFRYDPASQP
jgi:hypothetical protein